MKKWQSCCEPLKPLINSAIHNLKQYPHHYLSQARNRIKLQTEKIGETGRKGINRVVLNNKAQETFAILISDYRWITLPHHSSLCKQGFYIWIQLRTIREINVLCFFFHLVLQTLNNFLIIIFFSYSGHSILFYIVSCVEYTG